MAKRKKIHLLIIILAVIAALVLLLAWGRAAAKREASQPEMILFYGATCPHCKIVEEFIAQNSVRDRLSFRELEVYNDKTNARLLGEKAGQCGLDTGAGIGVPFFFDGQKCFVGDQDIIAYLKNQTQTK